MALLYIDGFDHYTVGTGIGNRLYERAASLWSDGGNSNNNSGDIVTMPVLGTGGARFIYATDINTGNARSTVILATPRMFVSGDKLCVGFHFYLNNLPTNNNRGALVNLIGNNNTTPGAGVSVSSGGGVVIRAGPDGTVWNTSGNTLVAGVLYHMEVQFGLHASTGTVDVRINGVSWAATTGRNTLSGHTSIVGIGFNGRQVNISNPGDTGTWVMDNLFVYDDTGSLNNDWLGAKFVDTLFANADSSPQDWSLSSGSNAYDLLNNVPPSSSDYVEAGTVGDTSRFETENLLDTVNVLGVQSVIQAHKTGTLTRSIDFGVVSGGIGDFGNTGNLIEDVPSYYSHVSEVDPNTTLPWIPSAVDSLKIEIERTT